MSSRHLHSSCDAIAEVCDCHCAGVKTFAYWGQGDNVDTTGPKAEVPLAQACTHCESSSFWPQYYTRHQCNVYAICIRNAWMKGASKHAQTIVIQLSARSEAELDLVHTI
jgi:hypothetical protein